MELLPPANVQRRIVALLGDAPWHRNDQLTSGCPGKGPCEAHPDRGVNPGSAKGIAYHVFEGPLRGTWSAWGDDAELLIFDRMVARMDDLWRKHLAAYGEVAALMRAAGK